MTTAERIVIAAAIVVLLFAFGFGLIVLYQALVLYDFSPMSAAGLIAGVLAVIGLVLLLIGVHKPRPKQPDFVNAPAEGLAMVDGKIYQKAINKADLDRYREDFTVISTKLIGGKLSLRIESESDPGSGFEPVPADLEDVYFSIISKKVDPITI